MVRGVCWAERLIMNLNTLLVVGFFATSTASLNAHATDAEQRAYQQASLAFYKQSGLETEVEKAFNKYKDHYIPKPVQYYLTNTAMLIKAVTEQKVTYTWSF